MKSFHRRHDDGVTTPRWGSPGRSPTSWCSWTTAWSSRAAAPEVLANPQNERTKAFLSKVLRAMPMRPDPAARLSARGAGLRLLRSVSALGFQIAINGDLDRPAVGWLLFARC